MQENSPLKVHKIQRSHFQFDSELYPQYKNPAIFLYPQYKDSGLFLYWQYKCRVWDVWLRLRLRFQSCPDIRLRVLKSV